MTCRGYLSFLRCLSRTALVVILSGLALAWPSLAQAADPTVSLTPGLYNLTYSPADEHHPCWSPQGDRIAFTSNGIDKNGDGRIDTVVAKRSVFTMRMAFPEAGKNLIRYPIPDRSALEAGKGRLNMATTTFQEADADVTSVTWQPNGFGFYVVVRERATGANYVGRFTFEPLDIANTLQYEQVYPKYGLSPTNRAIGTLAIASNNTSFYFDMYDTTANRWDIFNYIMPQPGRPEILTNLTPDGYRGAHAMPENANFQHPSLANSGQDLLFEYSEGEGIKSVWSASEMMGTPTAWFQGATAPSVREEETQARAAADGSIITFTSTRLTGPDDFQYDKNIWISTYNPKGTPVVRLYPDTGDTTDQQEPAPFVFAGQPNKMVFVSTKDGNYDIFLGNLVDMEAPLVASPPIMTVDGVMTKVAVPGATAKLTVKVRDFDTGVGSVWVQIKDPDSANLDKQGVNHVISIPRQDYRYFFNEPGASDYPMPNPPSLPNWYELDDRPEMATELPVEYGPLDPTTNTYLDLNNPASYPDYYAFATEDNRSSIYSSTYAGYCQEGRGYPEVPSHWLQMFDDGDPEHGDDIANDGYYSCLWVTPPADIAGDWYFDIIVEDNTQVALDSNMNWHGYRRRFDNIGGASTVMNLNGGRTILFVDDHADGQRFAYYGLHGVQQNTTSMGFLNTPYYFQKSDVYDGSSDTSPFIPEGMYDGSDLWRVMCRGPLPDSILNFYLPAPVMQIDPANYAQGAPFIARNGNRVVVWVSPSNWQRLNASWWKIHDSWYLPPSTEDDNGTQLATSLGSMVEEIVQGQLTRFVNDGGRLFVIGPDLPTALTADITQPSAFLTNLLGANVTAQAVLPYIIAPLHYSFVPGLVATSSWYATDMPTQFWPVGVSHRHPVDNVTDPFRGHSILDQRFSHDHHVLTRNFNPSQYVFNYIPTFSTSTLTWDVLQPTGNARAAFMCLDASSSAFPHNIAQAPIVGVSNDLQNRYGGRTVLWTFGYDHLSISYRNRPTNDTIRWLTDGQVSGKVMRNNEMSPIVGAVVTASTGSRVVAAMKTNEKGEYLIQGLRPGSYSIRVYANGYIANQTDGSDSRGVFIYGGSIASDVNFFMYRNVNRCKIWGYVTRSGRAVPRATVTATPGNGGDPLTPVIADETGRYEFPSIGDGIYTVKAVHPDIDRYSRTVVISPALIPGEDRKVDIEFGLPLPDMQAKTVEATEYKGDDEYNTGTWTERIQVATNETAVYHLKLQNDSDVSDFFTITAPTAPEGWTVKFYNSLTIDPAGDITSMLNGDGWVTNALAPGEAIEFLVEVTPDVTIAGDTTLSLPITAVSDNDPTKSDTLIVATVKQPLQQVLLTANPVAPRAAKQKITLSASVVGGGEVEYRFRVGRKIGATYEWTIIQNYSPKSTCEWTPMEPYDYTVVVHVREVGSTAMYQQYASIRYPVTLDLQNLQLTTNVRSPQPLGTQVTVTAVHVGGANVEYEFLAGGQVGEPVVIRPYDTSNRCIWTPANTGTYRLIVHAREMGSLDEKSATVDTFVITPKLSGVQLVANPASPRPYGTNVTMTAQATGGASVLYRFRVLWEENGVPKSALLRDFASDATCSWTPLSVGTYTLIVEAKEKDSTKVDDIVKYELNYVASWNLASVQLEANPPAKHLVAMGVYLKATPTMYPADFDNVLYRFLVYRDTDVKRETPVFERAYGTANNCIWVPEKAGAYQVYVEAREERKDTMAPVVGNLGANYIVNPFVSKVEIVPGLPSPRSVNTIIPLTATPTGGNNLEYYFRVGEKVNDSWVWTELRSYNINPTYNWQPTQPGNYRLVVWAREVGKTRAYDVYTTLDYVVTVPLSQVTLSTLKPGTTSTPLTSPQTSNTSIKLEARATGGANVEYKFEAGVLNGGETTWSLIQDYSSASSCVWIPPSTGSYILSVTAREQGKTVVKKSTTNYLIVPPISALTVKTSPSLKGAVGSPVIMTAVPTGGASPEYHFVVTRNGVEVFKQDYSTMDHCSWTPAAVGTYTIQVQAREAGWITAATSAEVTYTVTSVVSSVNLICTPVSPRPVNRPITLRAIPNGGANLEYLFRVATGTPKVWTVIRQYSDQDTCVWTPKVAGTYMVVVWAREKGTGSAYDQYKSINYVITEQLTGLSLNATPAFYGQIKSLITLVSTKTGGANVEYRFTAIAAGNTTLIRDFNASSTCTWTPSEIGPVTLKVEAREADDPANIQKVTSLAYTVTPHVTDVALTAGQASPRVRGTAVTLTATPTTDAVGGSAYVEYRFEQILKGATTTLRNYSDSNTCVWNPTVPGTYTLSVSARAKGSATVRTSTMTYVITDPISGVTLQGSPASQQPINTTITLNAVPENGAQLEYAFRVNNGTAWTMIRTYGTDASCTWTPKTLGNYTVEVWGREVGSANQFDQSAQIPFVITHRITGVTLRSNLASPRLVNTPITFTATSVTSPVSGAQVEYRYQVYQGHNLVTQGNYGTGSTFNWLPTAAGSYTIKVQARILGSTQEAEYTASMEYTIALPLVGVNLTLSPGNTEAQQVGTPVVMTAQGIQGANVEYKFIVTNQASVITATRDYSRTATWTWTPQDPGIYTIDVCAREVGDTGERVRQTVSYTVIARLVAVSLSISPASSQPTNTPITLTATASTQPATQASLMYEFTVTNGNGVTTFTRAYNATNNCVWTPSLPGLYTVVAKAYVLGGSPSYALSNQVTYVITAP